jgi:hypothetical protein
MALINSDQLTPRQLKTALTFAIKNHLPILIKGRPGTGKTDIVTQAAQEAQARLIISHPVVSDPTDFKGLPFADPDGETAKFLPFGDLAELTKAKEETVFFLDDLGQAPAAVQAACMQLILARRINGHMVSDKVTFLAATNRREDKAAVQGILEPVKSRFAAIVELIPDALEWSQWALKEGLPIELIGFNRFRPALMLDFKATADLTNSPSPRTIANLGRLQLAGCPTDLEFPLFCGAAGQGYATEYLAFLKIFRNLPNPDLVLMQPQTAEIPTDPATLYALCSALAARASDQNFSRLIEYANRLSEEEHGGIKHGEFSLMLISDILATKPELKNTKAFIDWSIKNQDLLI